MKVLIHGATNWGSSNFGDFIYVEAIIRHLKDSKTCESLKIAQPSEYFLKYITKRKYENFKNSEADVLIYAPGGYFGEGHQYRIRDVIIHFIRFFVVGIIASLRGKKIFVLGIGAGPINNWLFKLAVKYICRNAYSISVRDKESYDALTEIGLGNITLNFDPIVSISLKDWAIENKKVVLKTGCKNVLIHYNHSELAMKYFAEAIKKFCSEHKNINVIVSSDQVLANEDILYRKFNEVSGIDAFKYKYDNPYEFISLIKMCDAVLTCKLHVGVVAMMFEKSVVCAAEHPEKTERFYKHIGCPERCVSLYETNSEEILHKLNIFFNEKKQFFSDEDLKKSSMVWDKLDNLDEVRV